jgi:hypothetical protein
MTDNPRYPRLCPYPLWAIPTNIDVGETEELVVVVDLVCGDCP